MKLLCAHLFLSTVWARYVFEVAVSNRPGLGKEAKGGEDAWHGEEEVIAVADGVGGWSSHGVDPGIYSRMLMRHLARLFASRKAYFSQNPKELLIQAARSNTERGTSTFIVAALDPVKPLLRVASIGDSGYMILSPMPDGYRKVFRSVEQQHDFNFPYQVGTNGDDPIMAVNSTHPTSAGDLLIVASDGLFDNMFDEAIVDMVNKNRDSVKSIAEELVKRAFALSIRKDYDSPFAIHARKYGMDFTGGKNDDITVIVGRVKSSAPAVHFDNGVDDIEA